LARIVHRDVVRMQIRGAKEAYEPVAQVLALHQNENRHDQDDDGGLEWSKDRLDSPARATVSTEGFGGASSTTTGCCCVPPAGRAAESAVPRRGGRLEVQPGSGRLRTADDPRD
jgi:hypothetical protein